MTDATNFVTVEAPELISTGAQAIVERAQSLGLTWQLRPGKVTKASITLYSVLFDGDTQAVNCLNLSGQPFAIGSRCMGLMVPPSSNYIIGSIVGASVPKYFNTVAATNGQTISATYVDMPGSPGVTITKACAAGITNLEVHIYGTFYVLTAAAGLDIGVAAGTTGDVNVTGVRSANSALSSHTPYAGVVSLTGMGAGTHTITARWRRNTGTGALTVDAGDVLSMSVREVPA